MADELSLTLVLDYEKGTYSAFRAFRDLLITVAGERVHRTTQAVGTSEEALSLGDCGVGGFCLLYNHDPTNYVEVKPIASTAPLVRINPLEFAAFRIALLDHLGNALVPYIQANTAACDVEIILLEA